MDVETVALFLSTERVTTSRAVATKFDVSLRLARQALEGLVAMGKARATGVKRGRKFEAVG